MNVYIYRRRRFDIYIYIFVGVCVCFLLGVLERAKHRRMVETDGWMDLYLLYRSTGYRYDVEKV